MQTPKFSLWICALVLCGGMTLRADDTPAQAEARAALMQQLQELQGNSTPATPAPSSTPAASAPTPAPAPATTPVVAAPVNPQTGDTQAQAQARAALYQKMSDLGIPMSQTTVTTTPVDAKNNTNIPNNASTATTIQRIPIVAPPLPVSLSQEEKLRMLLAHYEANQITPEQYQQQRAAILAAP